MPTRIAIALFAFGLFLQGRTRSGIICNACLIYICCIYSIYDCFQSTKFMLLLLFLDEGNAFMRHEFGENLLMH